MSLEEYQMLQITDLHTFYTRACYNPLKRTLTPPFKNWLTICLCKKPANPNMFYIGCESCEEWFHPVCIGMTNDEAAKIDKFFCSECKSGKKKSCKPKKESLNKSTEKVKVESKSKSPKKEKSAKKEKSTKKEKSEKKEKSAKKEKTSKTKQIDKPKDEITA